MAKITVDSCSTPIGGKLGLDVDRCVRDGHSRRIEFVVHIECGMDVDPYSLGIHRKLRMNKIAQSVGIEDKRVRLDSRAKCLLKQLGNNRLGSVISNLIKHVLG